MSDLTSPSPSPLPSPTPPRDQDPADEISRMIMCGLASADTGPPSPTPSSTRANAGGALQSSRTNAALHARRVAQRFSLSTPYSRELEDFTAEDPATRQLLQFARLLGILQMVSSIVVDAGPYKVSKPLADNVKKYCTAVLLSPKLDSYKGIRPVEQVLAVVVRVGTNVPDNILKDAHIRRVLAEHIATELTQQRSNIKKKVKKSVKNKQSIYELANNVIDGTQCVVTVEVCARLALLRKVYEEEGKSDGKYWDYIDERLVLIRERTSHDADKISAFFSVALKEDRVRYGNASEAAQGQITNPWQVSVNDALSNDTPVFDTPLDDINNNED